MGHISYSFLYNLVQSPPIVLLVKHCDYYSMSLFRRDPLTTIMYTLRPKPDAVVDSWFTLSKDCRVYETSTILEKVSYWISPI